MSRNIDPTIMKKIKEAESKHLVDLYQLEVGTKLKVGTKNTVYTIELLDPEDGLVLISGNKKYCPEPFKAIFHGCTFGGSMIMPGKLGHMMHMEVELEKSGKTFTSSPIHHVSIEGNGWNYKMEWYDDADGYV